MDSINAYWHPCSFHVPKRISSKRAFTKLPTYGAWRIRKQIFQQRDSTVLAATTKLLTFSDTYNRRNRCKNHQQTHAQKSKDLRAKEQLVTQYSIVRSDQIKRPKFWSRNSPIPDILVSARDKVVIQPLVQTTEQELPLLQNIKRHFSQLADSICITSLITRLVSKETCQATSQNCWGKWNCKPKHNSSTQPVQSQSFASLYIQIDVHH